MPETKSIRAASRELIVIILGVLIALAADRWMEGVRESRDEGRYLSRIAADLDLTIAELEVVLPRLERGLEAAETLSHPEAASLPPDSIVTLYIAAGHTGAGRSQLGSDVAFRELVASGGLNLLSDVDLRGALSEFYLNFEDLAAAFADAERLDVTVAELTGSLPYLVQGELPEEAKSRILEAALRIPGAQRDFRIAHARIGHHVNRVRGVIENAVAVRERLN